MTQLKTGKIEGKYGNGVTFERVFTKPGVHPYDEIEWEPRDAVIKNERGDEVFKQTGVEVPKFWSQTATNIVAQKYFKGILGTTTREYSAKQLIDRVAITITNWGRKDGYFQTSEDADVFEHELTYLLINQLMAFNSPVWFNVGAVEQPQCSACFINEVKDSIQSILDLAKTEGMLFKSGSGSGVNVSPLRSKKESLSLGGTSSGPVSFMKGIDAMAGSIKSGGTTRRAAKMVIMNIDHPDILDFVRSKANEERKAWALIDAGYDSSFNGEAYNSISFQNANHSVRVTDEFMKAVEQDKDWTTKFVVSGKPADTYKARDLMKDISDAAWICGDPGMQYDTMINKWHTCPNTDMIHASNPCSEYMFLNNTACNLASLNLMKFRTDGGAIDTGLFKKAIATTITAMEIIVGNAGYPTPQITQMSHDYRTLGLGYANLGALLMSRGQAYDSDEGRNFAAAITSLMTGEAYRQSALIAEYMEPFPGYKINEEPMLHVIDMHRQATKKIETDGVSEELLKEAESSWEEAYTLGKKHGYRNAQASVLAPTGTIAFLMDCDTTGIEPPIALVSYKWLVGGGMIKMVNNIVPEALRTLGYSDEESTEILEYLDKNDTIEGAPHLKTEHLPVFDCAFKPANGKRSIHYLGHVKMMAATQPFISGAISKTVNMPNDATPEEISKVYLDAWKLGLKAIAIYRDGCKRTQPVTTDKKGRSSEVVPMDSFGTTSTKKQVQIQEKIVYKARRERMPDERRSITHKFSIANHEGYITVGEYEDSRPGELFIVMAKQGSTISGLMDTFATSVSIALQYGVPIDVLVRKFTNTKYEPSGVTTNPEIRMAKSITDYIFRWLASKYLNTKEQRLAGLYDTGQQLTLAETTTVLTPMPIENTVMTTAMSGISGNLRSTANSIVTFEVESDSPPCPDCGAIMVRNGACYKCLNCGSSSGCS
ncbi:MAG: vitamin B12-dependent ribonucleotide reductase [DPANN group archaeon]|nr:vitamin B12-dependent ribonucleotide reductase [DPANN group archaeon]